MNIKKCKYKFTKWYYSLSLEQELLLEVCATLLVGLFMLILIYLSGFNTLLIAACTSFVISFTMTYILINLFRR